MPSGKGKFGFCVRARNACQGAAVKVGWKHCRGKLEFEGTSGITVNVTKPACEKGSALVIISGGSLFTSTGQTLVNPAALTSVFGPVRSGSTTLPPSATTPPSSQVILETSGNVAPGAAGNFTITAVLNSVALPGSTIIVPVTVAGNFTYRAVLNGSAVTATLTYDNGAATVINGGSISLSYAATNIFDIQASLSAAGSISGYASSITLV